MQGNSEAIEYDYNGKIHSKNKKRLFAKCQQKTATTETVADDPGFISGTVFVGIDYFPYLLPVDFFLRHAFFLCDQYDCTNERAFQKRRGTVDKK